MTTALAKQSTNGWLLAPGSFDELLKFCDIIAKSDLAPKDYKGKPGNVVVAVQLGAAVGLMPLQSLQGIAVINGKPGMYGDALLAVVMAHPSYEWHTEEWDAATETYTCTLKRKGRPPTVQAFSRRDATLAHLWGKQGPWSTNPRRMLQMRARGFCLRDGAADILMGLGSAEELQDIQDDQTVVTKAPAAARLVDNAPVDLAAMDRGLRIVEGAAKALAEQKPAEVIDAATGEVLPAKPRAIFRGKKPLAGKIIEDAPASVIADYIVMLRGLDQTASVVTHTTEVEDIYEAKIAAEMQAEEKATKAAKLNESLDTLGRDLEEESNSNEAWGLAPAPEQSP